MLPGGMLLGGVLSPRGMYLVPGVYLVWGVSALGGCLLPGGSAHGGVCSRGGMLPGVCSRGCLLRGVYLVWGDTGIHLPPWTEFLTHASENITLPQTSFAGGNKTSRLVAWMGLVLNWYFLVPKSRTQRGQFSINGSFF